MAGKVLNIKVNSPLNFYPQHGHVCTLPLAEGAALAACEKPGETDVGCGEENNK